MSMGLWLIQFIGAKIQKIICNLWSLVSVLIYSYILWLVYDLLWLKPPSYFIWYYITGKLLYTSSGRQIFTAAGITYSAVLFVGSHHEFLSGHYPSFWVKPMEKVSCLYLCTLRSTSLYISCFI